MISFGEGHVCLTGTEHVWMPMITPKLSLLPLWDRAHEKNGEITLFKWGKKRGPLWTKPLISKYASKAYQIIACLMKQLKEYHKIEIYHSSFSDTDATFEGIPGNELQGKPCLSGFSPKLTDLSNRTQKISLARSLLKQSLDVTIIAAARVLYILIYQA